MPNFLLIGTQKGGTTSLYSYLKQHPQVYMSPLKEPLYFMTSGMDDAPSSTVNDLNTYKKLFEGVTNEKAIGEASTTYLACPWTPKLIKETIPDVKMIAVLRNPVDRAWSHYLMHAAKGHPMFSADFAKAIQETKVYRRAGETWKFGYISMGMYYEQLQRYYSIFEREQIKIIFYQDILDDIQGVLRSIFSFLGIDNSFITDTSQRKNVSQVTRSTKLDRIIYGQGRLKKAITPFIPNSMKSIVKERMRKLNKHKPTLPSQQKNYLIETYREEIVKLQDFVNRDLSSWLH